MFFLEKVLLFCFALGLPVNTARFNADLPYVVSWLTLWPISAMSCKILVYYISIRYRNW